MGATPESLLDRARSSTPDPAAWRSLVEIYTPLLRAWLARAADLRGELDDVLQDVLAVLVAELPRFERRREGAFRAWLRAVAINRVRAFVRDRRRAPAAGGPAAEAALAAAEDPAGELARAWDAEHDRAVARRLVELVEPEFAPSTARAFRLVALEGRTPAEAAAELGLTVNAVLVAKSRFLKRLREEGRGLID